MTTPLAEPLSVATLVRRLVEAEGLEIEVDGEADCELRGVAPLARAAAGDLSFFADERLRALLARTGASALFVPLDLDRRMVGRADVVLLKTSHPHLAFARALALLFPLRLPDFDRSTASIHPRAEVHPTAFVGPHSIVCQEARIGAGAILYASVFVGPGARIGEDSVLHPFVTVHAGVVLGRRVCVHPGAVLGSDGFGLTAGRVGHEKVPQVGGLDVGDDVEIGAGVTIDRGALEATVIGRGCKLDNQVHVGHNVRLGQDCILVAQVGISGSTRLGDRVVMAGQAGASGHLTIGSDVRLAARAAAVTDLDQAGDYGGFPAVRASIWRRQLAALRRLPEALRLLRRLRARVDDLEARLGHPSSMGAKP